MFERIRLNFPFSRGLPKTGQATSYDTGDDGQYEAGWWLRRLNANNKTRFLVKTLSGDDVVIDLATGLMWARDGDANGCAMGAKKNWGLALDFALDLTFAGYSDWRLPNIMELFSIIKHEDYNPAIWAEFTNTKYTDNYWSSTTRKFSTSYARALSFSEGSYYTKAKTDSYYLRLVRGGV